MISVVYLTYQSYLLFFREKVDGGVSSVIKFGPDQFDRKSDLWPVRYDIGLDRLLNCS